MRTLVFLALSWLSISATWAQSNNVTQTPDLPVNRVVVIGDATLELPADQVQVAVTLQFSDPTDARKAYDSHRAAEKKLVQLIKTFTIDEKDIVYSPVSVNKSVDIYGQDGRRREEVNTNQQVIFKLNDLKKYPDLQLALISGGFNRFNASFTSTIAEQNKNKALEKAIEVARDKAAVMAKAAGRTLGSILSVRDTEETDPILRRVVPLYASAARKEMAMDAGTLSDIPQKIVIPAQVKVTFELR